MRKVIYETKVGKVTSWAEARRIGGYVARLEDVPEPPHIFLSEKKKAMRMTIK